MTTKCEHCHSALVYIDPHTLAESKRLLKPNFKTQSRKITTNFGGSYSICPKCDAYALGLDLETPFPIVLQDAQHTNIRELEQR